MTQAWHQWQQELETLLASFEREIAVQTMRIITTGGKQQFTYDDDAARRVGRVVLDKASKINELLIGMRGPNAHVSPPLPTHSLTTPPPAIVGGTTTAYTEALSVALVKRIDLDFSNLSQEIAISVNEIRARQCINTSDVRMLMIYATLTMKDTLMMLFQTRHKYLLSIVVDECAEKLTYRIDKYQEPLITTLKSKQIEDKSRNPNSNECTGEFIETADYPSKIVLMIAFKSKLDRPNSLQGFMSRVDNRWYTGADFDFMLIPRSCSALMKNPLITMGFVKE